MEGEAAESGDENSIAAAESDDDDNSILALKNTINGDVSSPSKENKEDGDNGLANPTNGEEASSSQPTAEKEDKEVKRQVTFQEVNIASALEKVIELRPTGNQEFLSALHSAAVMLEEDGRYDEALSLFNEALKARSKVSGDKHRATLTAMNSLASCLVGAKRYAEAEIHMNKCIETASLEYGENDPFVLSVRSNLGSLYRSTNRNEDAVTCFEDVVNKHRQNCADDDGDLNAETLVAMSLLASTLEVLKRYDRSADLNQEILMVVGQGSKVLGEDYAVFLASVMNSLAYEQRMLGREIESEAMYRRCLEKRAQLLGVHHVDYLSTLQNFAVLLSTMSQFEEAEPLFRQVIDGRTTLFGDRGIPTMESKSFLGIMFSNAGNRHNILSTYDTTHMTPYQSISLNTHPIHLSPQTAIDLPHRREI